MRSLPFGWMAITGLLLVLLVNLLPVSLSATPAMSTAPRLLTDPFLQLPTENSVRVVWFTEFSGSQHRVNYGHQLEQSISATTTRLSRTREDINSKWHGSLPSDQRPIHRDIWRHEAEVVGLTQGERLPYQVVSVRDDGAQAQSETFTLAPKPRPGTPLKILLTSDHQLKPMVAANLQKVVETVGQVDAIFFAGDLVNVPDRASEWFDDSRGGAFFPALQGRASYELTHQDIKTRYRGGALIQHAPLFAAIGNHEVMGRFSKESGLNDQFDNSVPRQATTQERPDQARLQPDLTELKNQSFNTDTYEEIFSLPESESGGKRYYAVTWGDVRLVVLYITNMWRSPSLAANSKGKYRERSQDLNIPENWGHGQHIFEAIAPGSPQYTWLTQELTSPEFRDAKYRVVMFHHPPHSLGENSVPAYTDPVPVVSRDASGQITALRYEYPLAADYIVRDVVPLLETAGAQLVFYGHSHLWNRFVSEHGTHFLESSNVGNSYGAYLGDKRRNVPKNYQEQYAETGNPNGLEPVVPTIAPLLSPSGDPLPYIASNQITAFSLLDTESGTVSSYRFDTQDPRSPVIKFDEFPLKP